MKISFHWKTLKQPLKPANNSQPTTQPLHAPDDLESDESPQIQEHTINENQILEENMNLSEVTQETLIPLQTNN